jgi:hypothetical protein
LALQSSGNTIATFGSNLNVAVVGNVSAANIVVTTGITYSNGAAYSSGGGGLTMAAVQTANITAVAGTIYPVNTTSANITATLPASPAAGSQIQFVDYAGTFGTYSLKIYPVGLKIQGNTSNVTLSTNRSSAALMYTDATQGWIGYNGFVSNPIGNYSVEALVLAGGGGAANYGGGGAGGLIYVSATTVVPGTAYLVTIGAGGANGASGSNTSALGQTAIGGGGGYVSSYQARSGGSGAGNSFGSQYGGPGAGTAGQGNPGGQGQDGVSAFTTGGGGGGASVSGSAGGGQGSPAGAGGAGASYSISGASVTYAGGGGGASNSGGQGAGGLGGGGTGSTSSANAGGTNLGGGGGGGSGAGGSGIVVIRYLGGQRATGGSYTSSGGYSIHTFTGSGTFIA